MNIEIFIEDTVYDRLKGILPLWGMLVSGSIVTTLFSHGKKRLFREINYLTIHIFHGILFFFREIYG